LKRAEFKPKRSGKGEERGFGGARAGRKKEQKGTKGGAKKRMGRGSTGGIAAQSGKFKYGYQGQIDIQERKGDTR